MDSRNTALAKFSRSVTKCGNITNCVFFHSQTRRADIIKIEHPTRGDDTRAWGPPYAEAKDGISDGQSAYFLSVSFNL